MLSSFSQYTSNSESYFYDTIEKLDSNLLEINNCFDKITNAQKISKLEKDPILKLMTLNADEAITKVKKIIPENPSSYNNPKLFYGLSQELERIIECFIKDKFESFLNARLSNIEKTLEEHDKAINSNTELSSNQQSEVFSDLLSQIEKRNREFDNWKLELENKAISVNPQINQIAEDIEKRLSILNEKQKIVENWIRDLQLQLQDKTSELLNTNNELKLERDFRKVCFPYENELRSICSSIAPLSQAYQDYIKAFHHKSSLYLVAKVNDSTNLFIYDTENEREEVKVLKTPEILSTGTCWAKIPNGGLFCFGNYPSSGISLIISENGEVQMLPYGTPCHLSSAVYFNRNVYCFGGVYNGIPSNISDRFDLERNQWVKLNSLPQFDYKCSCILVNGYILIAGCVSRNLWRYSISLNCFERILYKFAGEKRKLLINLGKLYLIECDGSIYESGFNDDNNWKQIANAKMSSNVPSQVGCSFNKGTVYIGASIDERYFKFNLSENVMLRL
ncbi:unnamed protein product [Blepharisma stoltei]|uniref:Uncharacterized protein n=1 Tax=Blepharisma stoltei TaxID=1481888 RepID=A0AAU9KBP6_9CILI|nr:unnamed protein product [Blepharisma stoltei]